MKAQIINDYCIKRCDATQSHIYAIMSGYTVSHSQNQCYLQLLLWELKNSQINHCPTMHNVWTEGVVFVTYKNVFMLWKVILIFQTYPQKYYIRFTSTQGSQDTPVCIRTKQSAGQLANRVSIRSRRKRFFYFPKCQGRTCGLQSLIYNFQG